MWAGQPHCGLTMFEGHLRGLGCRQHHEGSQVPLPAIRNLNSEPTPGSFRVVLLNPGTRPPSALVCSFPEKSSGARGRPIAVGSEEQDVGEGERKPQQARSMQASPGGKGLPWGRYHTGSWDSGPRLRRGLQGRGDGGAGPAREGGRVLRAADRKSTRLNSSHSH